MPKGVEIRPTQDKVREAVFNVLGDVSGKSVLELFAGSGAFGIEAISRGARYVTFVDNNFRCTEMILANLRSLGVNAGRYNVIKTDAIKVFPKLAALSKKFDIIFMDPPYYRELAKKCLINMDSYDILSPIGLAIVEHFKKDILYTNPKTFLLNQERKYGDSVITIFEKSALRTNDESQDSGLPRNF